MSVGLSWTIATLTLSRLRPCTVRSELRAVYLRSLALLLQAGVPIDRSLATLSRGTDEKQLAAASARMAEAVQRGATLSQAMLGCPRAFQLFHAEAVQLGERTGQLDKVLLRLADQEERSAHLSTRLRSALHYPLLVVALSFVFLLLGPPLLFKNLLPVLQAGGQSLPLLTQAFMALSLSLQDPRLWLWGAAVGFSLWRMASFWARRGRNPSRLRRLLLALPVVGNLFRCVALSEFARALSLQLECGCEAREALVQAARCSGDRVLLERIAPACHALSEGKGISAALRGTAYFPPTFLSILEVGEESGQIPDLALRVSQFYDEHLDTAARNLAALVEPLALLGLGSAAALTIFALVVPLLRVAEGLS